MSEMSITLPQQGALEPGSEIDVDVQWDLDRPTNRLELRLVWNTTGKGDRDLKVAKTMHIHDPELKGNERLTFILPWGPYSFSGKLISLVWAFELVDVSSDASIREEFVLAPGGREVVLLAKR
ncbi:MAG: hypothetical protein KDA58_07770 [Planctomycetaceae bacterium]|nr:hypothetical protein [Planctomycetaceae bacterium]